MRPKWVNDRLKCYTGLLWQKEATLENDISRKWAKCVCVYIDINAILSCADLTHAERRPQNIYSQEEINLYCIIKLAT